MKKTICSLLMVLFCGTLNTFAQKPFDIDLWPNGLPNSNGRDKTEPFSDKTRNFKPTIRIFLPEKDKANGKAILACPGGGYTHLATDHEGYQWAKFYNDLGFAYIVLKYRTPNGVTEVPISDAKEAMRVVRENAEKWNINPRKVGIMGSSAGGHLASTIATHSDTLTAPAFQILFYPVITFDKKFTHMGSRNNLIGEDPTPDKVMAYSNELMVTSKTAPAIMLLSDDDKVVPSQNSINYYLALRNNGVKATLHVYPSGGHGWGCKKDFKYHNEMIADLTAWLKTL